MDNIILVIEKYNNSNFFWDRLSKKYNDFKEIIDKYNGFEGNCIKYIPVRNNLTNVLKFAIDEFKNNFNKNTNNYRLLYITTSKKNSNEIKDRFNFIGYEYGFYKDDSNIYSSIFHEVIFGNILELITFKNKLNDNFLFTNYRTAQNYFETHNYLLKSGIDVEDEKGMFIYKVLEYL